MVVMEEMVVVEEEKLVEVALAAMVNSWHFRVPDLYHRSWVDLVVSTHPE